MIFPLNTFVHSYRQPWEVPHPIHYAMLMIFIFYIQTHNYTITPSYRLRFVTGTNSRLRLVVRLVLKTRINNNISLPPSYYFTGKRLGQIYHARLRTKCRSLRHHLFSINIIECPRCICGSLEDIHHYLLVCYQYTNIRRELLTTVSGICNPTLNVLLYGDPSLSLEQNKYIVKIVQDFILKSNRFQ